MKIFEFNTFSKKDGSNIEINDLTPDNFLSFIYKNKYYFYEKNLNEKELKEFKENSTFKKQFLNPKKKDKEYPIFQKIRLNEIFLSKENDENIQKILNYLENDKNINRESFFFCIPIPVGLSYFGRAKFDFNKKLEKKCSERFEFKGQLRKELHQIETTNKILEHFDKQMPCGLVNLPCGYGKCFFPETRVKLFNGNVKLVKNITFEDELCGFDGDKKTIKNIVRGKDKMYTLRFGYYRSWGKIGGLFKENFIYRFTVNSEHILVVYDKIYKCIKTISIMDFMKEKKRYFAVFNIPMDEIFFKEINNCLNKEPIIGNCEKYEIDFKKNFFSNIDNIPILNNLIKDGDLKIRRYYCREILKKVFKYNSKENYYLCNVQYSINFQIFYKLMFILQRSGYFFDFLNFDLDNYINFYDPDGLQLLINNKKKYLYNEEEKIICVKDYFNIETSYPVESLKTYFFVVEMDIFENSNVDEYVGFEFKEKNKMFELWNGIVVHNTAVSLYTISKLQLNTLFIVHKTDILDQTIREINKFLPKCKVGIINTSKTIQFKGYDVVVATIQTLHSIYKSDNLLFDEISNYFEYCIFDESHHVAAETFHCVVTNLFSKYKLGLSATPKRSDGLTKLIHAELGPTIVKKKRNLDEELTVNFHNLNNPNATIFNYQEIKKYNTIIKVLSHYDLSRLNKEITNNSDRRKYITTLFWKEMKNSEFKRKCILLSELVDDLKSQFTYIINTWTNFLYNPTFAYSSINSSNRIIEKKPFFLNLKHIEEFKSIKIKTKILNTKKNEIYLFIYYLIKDELILFEILKHKDNFQYWDFKNEKDTLTITDFIKKYFKDQYDFIQTKIKDKKKISRNIIKYINNKNNDVKLKLKNINNFYLSTLDDQDHQLFNFKMKYQQIDNILNKKILNIYENCDFNVVFRIGHLVRNLRNFIKIYIKDSNTMLATFDMCGEAFDNKTLDTGIAMMTKRKFEQIEGRILRPDHTKQKPIWHIICIKNYDKVLKDKLKILDYLKKNKRKINEIDI